MKKVGDRRIMTQEGEGKWSTCCKLREYQKPLDNISMCPAADFRKATYIKVFFARYLTHPASLAMKILLSILQNVWNMARNLR